MDIKTEDKVTKVENTKPTVETPIDTEKEIPTRSAKKSDILDYYMNGGAFNYQQVAEHFNVDIEDVCTILENR